MARTEPETTDHRHLTPEFADLNRTLVLLGAGASAEAGLPLTNALTEVIVGAVNDSHDRGAAALLNFVCSALLTHDAALQGTSPYSGLNVERVFSAIRMLTEREKLEIAPFVQSWHPGLDQSTGLAPFWAKRFQESVFSQFGTHQLEQEFKRGVEAIAGRSHSRLEYENLRTTMTAALRAALERFGDVSYLHPLVRAAPHATLPLVTLNYDRTIEAAAKQLELPVYTGLEAFADGRGWEADGSSVNLLKVHGSIDWRLRNAMRAAESLPSTDLDLSLNPPFWYRVAAGEAVAADDAELCWCGAARGSLMVFRGDF